MSKSPRKHSLTYEIALTASLLESAMQKRFREEGVHITPQQLAVLALLEKQPEGVTMHFISEKTFRDKSATTRIVDNLEKAHYAERHHLPGDRRVRLICIREEGFKVLEIASRVARQHVELALYDISEKDQGTTIHVVERIKTNLKNI